MIVNVEREPNRSLYYLGGLLLFILKPEKYLIISLYLSTQLYSIFSSGLNSLKSNVLSISLFEHTSYFVGKQKYSQKRN